MPARLLGIVCLLSGLVCAQYARAATVDLKRAAPGMVQNLVDCIQTRAPSFDCMGLGVKPEVTCKSAVFHVDRLLTTVEMNVRYRLQVRNKVLCDESSVAAFNYNLMAKHPSAGNVTFTTKLGSFEVPMLAVEVALAPDCARALKLIRASGQYTREGQSEYDDQRNNSIKRHGPENIYIASPDFVQWASPETAGRWIIDWVDTGGTNCEAIAEESQEIAHKEIRGIAAWLEKKGRAEAQKMAHKLMNGQPVSIPNGCIRLAWKPVRYKSTRTVGGKKIGGPIDVPHAAFVLIWLDASNPTRPQAISPSETVKPED